MALPQAIDIRISMLRLAPQCFAFTSIYIYIYRRARCTTRTCGARSNTCRVNENRLWNASLRDNLSYILYIYIYIYIYMFALHKPVKERFSEGSETVVLLSVVLSGLPVGIVLLE